MGSAVLRNCLNIFLDHRNKDSEEDEVPSPLPVLSRGCQLSATILSWQRVCLHLLWQDSPGIPELDSTFAGLSLSGKVVLQATSQNTFKLAMKEVGFSQFNEKFSGMKPFNWRNVVTPATSPVIGMAKQYMESPVEFSITTGDLTSVKVSSSEPEWSVNFKKALITALKIQLPVQQAQ